MNPETINSVIDHLANKLAIPTGQLMEMLPRLGYKDLYALIAEILVFCISAAVCAWCINIATKTCNESPLIIPIAITSVTAIIFLFMSLFELAGVLFWLHDPQAWAFDYVLKMLK